MEVPYCGLAPLPAELLGRWNFDPFLIAAMAVIAGVHAVALRDDDRERTLLGGGAMPGGKAVRYAIAWLLLGAIFISPFCALASSLFSARVAHHVLLIGAAAPLLVLALPAPLRSLRFPVAVIGGAAFLHTVVLWFWHAPVPYAAALASHGTYWLMELSLLGSAILLWLAILSPRASFGSVMTTLLGTVIQMGLLGALITFARAPLYEAHFATTEPWGMTALADQQLAGLIMWVPAAIPYVLAAMAVAVRRLAQLERPAELAS